MAITTDSYIDVISGGITYDRIGLSKTINNYTFNDLFENAYCGQYDISRLNNHLSENDVSFTSGNNLWNYSVTYSNNKWSEGGNAANYSDPNGLYGKVIWLQCNSTFDNSVTVSNFSKYKLVTEWDAPKYCADAPSLNAGPCSASLVPPNWNTDKPFPAIYYAPGDIVLAYRSHLTFPDDVSIEIQGIRPYMICKFNDIGFIYKFDMNEGMHYFYGANSYYGSPDLFAVGGITSFDTTYSLAEAMSCDYMSPQSSGYDFSGYPDDSVFPLTLPLGSTGATNKGMISSDQRYIVKLTTGGSYVGMYAGVEFRSYFTRRHDALMFFANMGIKFYAGPAGKHYKPIIENGIVIDFSENLEDPSELDDWTGSTSHDVPDSPEPTPPGPGPYDDDPWSGASFSGVGVGGAGAFAKCYYMTSTELANLRSWMNSNNVPEGFDPMAQIIGLSQVPVNLSGDDNTTVQFVNSSAVYDPGVTRLVDSGVNTQIAMGIPIRYSLGSVDIVRRMQQRGEPYLDYDCQIELYLPLIGMFSLDTQAVMGRTITAEAVLDPISGTLAAYAYVTRDGQNLPIAYGSTTIGVDLPITAQQYSVARAALKQANAQLGTSLLSSTLSLIAAATAGGKGSGTGAKTATGSTNGLAAAGIREAGADYMKASQAGNVFGDFMQWGRTIRQLSYGNNTAIAGSFGGSTAQWSYPFTPYVKINRPRYEKPSNYKHSQGVPCVQTKKVGSCTGFIQCIGVDVSGITGATDIELQAIQAALTNGVFAGGGS